MAATDRETMEPRFYADPGPDGWYPEFQGVRKRPLGVSFSTRYDRKVYHHLDIIRLSGLQADWTSDRVRSDFKHARVTETFPVRCKERDVALDFDEPSKCLEAVRKIEAMIAQQSLCRELTVSVVGTSMTPETWQKRLMVKLVKGRIEDIPLPTLSSNKRKSDVVRVNNKPDGKKKPRIVDTPGRKGDTSGHQGDTSGRTIDAHDHETSIDKSSPASKETTDFQPFTGHFEANKATQVTHSATFAPNFVASVPGRLILAKTEQQVTALDPTAKPCSIDKLDGVQLAQLGLKRTYVWDVDDDLKKTYEVNNEVLALPPKGASDL